jgi:myo-inositol-1(or 4)-monophosphatase
MTDFYKERAVAIEAALAGGEVLKNYYGKHLDISYKGGDLDLVTTADTKSEETIVSILGKRLPGVAVLAEEGGQSGGSTKRRFLVDPLDGTTNFAHGYPHFAVSIGYEHEGQMQVGVVYDPLREELFVAEKGEGTFLNGKKIHVSASLDLGRALLITGFPYDLRDDVTATLRFFNRFMAVARAIRRDGSAALNLCYVGAGRCDGYWEEKLSAWDIAAGSLIVSEASGKVTNLKGETFNCFEGSVLATNGPLHEAMLEVLLSVDTV